MEKYKLEIQFKAGFTIGSGFGFASFVDSCTIRDYNQVAYIPGSTIKGKLRSVCKKIALELGDEFGEKKDVNGNVIRQALCQLEGSEDKTKALCKDFSTCCVICKVFGSPLFPSEFRFSNLLPDDDSYDVFATINKLRQSGKKVDAEWVTRIRKDRYLNRAADNALFVHEQVLAKDKKYIGVISAPQFNDEAIKLLDFGLKALTFLGGGSAKGLGKVIYAELKPWAEISNENLNANVKMGE